MTNNTYRRLYGLALGAGLGLAVGFTSQTLNSFAVPGIDFHQPPLGMSGNVLLCVLAGALVGLISCWLTSSLISVLIAAVLGGIIVEISGTFYGTYVAPGEVGNTLFLLLLLLLPMTGLLGAVFGLLRWIVNRQVALQRDHAPLLRRMFVPALALVVMGAAGLISVYPAEGQQRVREMNDLVQAGLHASAAASWPAPLVNYADSFPQRATPHYTLQWVRGETLPEWHIGTPSGFQSWQFSIVAARFDTGWILACLFSPDNSTPNCRAYDRDPTLNYPADSE